MKKGYAYSVLIGLVAIDPHFVFNIRRNLEHIESGFYTVQDCILSIKKVTMLAIQARLNGSGDSAANFSMEQSQHVVNAKTRIVLEMYDLLRSGKPEAAFQRYFELHQKFFPNMPKIVVQKDLVMFLDLLEKQDPVGDFLDMLREAKEATSTFTKDKFMKFLNKDTDRIKEELQKQFPGKNTDELYLELKEFFYVFFNRGMHMAKKVLTSESCGIADEHILFVMNLQPNSKFAFKKM